MRTRLRSTVLKCPITLSLLFFQRDIFRNIIYFQMQKQSQSVIHTLENYLKLQLDQIGANIRRLCLNGGKIILKLCSRAKGRSHDLMFYDKHPGHMVCFLFMLSTHCQLIVSTLNMRTRIKIRQHKVGFHVTFYLFSKSLISASLGQLMSTDLCCLSLSRLQFAPLSLYHIFHNLN